MAGTLYIVATPIGNLDDMPPRVAATFGAADFIAAEDTRVTMKLLNFLGLKKPMVSYYEHALQKGEGILRRIEAGESCALCSDAGMQIPFHNLRLFSNQSCPARLIHQYL